MDFSAGALLVGVKFCMAVQPHLRQVFYCGGMGIAAVMAELWALTGAIWWDMLLAEAAEAFAVYFCGLFFCRFRRHCGTDCLFC